MLQTPPSLPSVSGIARPFTSHDIFASLDASNCPSWHQIPPSKLRPPCLALRHLPSVHPRQHAHIPSVPEVGATSAPLLSASYFIGARCRPYNDDFMKCKTDAHGKGEIDCLSEGRRVTRCAASVLDDVNKHCLEAFRAHWKCLEDENHQLWQCRKPERALNACMFAKLGLYKALPDAQGIPVYARQEQIYATKSQADKSFWEQSKEKTQDRRLLKITEQDIQKRGAEAKTPEEQERFAKWEAAVTERKETPGLYFAKKNLADHTQKLAKDNPQEFAVLRDGAVGQKAKQ
ncbi:hypothetical protein FH972_022515 [Carpinus fangiana]|uniref:CHCH domain-containing protein n=1 Tax=Carpinus fangiana TaxID=176857 RepID=A0A5N6KSG4_9ROSI|nr:hypothetical protein FH972_022515 [Carpinus fangiana]